DLRDRAARPARSRCASHLQRPADAELGRSQGAACTSSAACPVPPLACSKLRRSGKRLTALQGLEPERAFPGKRLGETETELFVGASAVVPEAVLGEGSDLSRQGLCGAPRCTVLDQTIRQSD